MARERNAYNGNLKLTSWRTCDHHGRCRVMQPVPESILSTTLTRNLPTVGVRIIDLLASPGVRMHKHIAMCATAALPTSSLRNNPQENKSNDWPLLAAAHMSTSVAASNQSDISSALHCTWQTHLQTNVTKSCAEFLHA